MSNRTLEGYMNSHPETAGKAYTDPRNNVTYSAIYMNSKNILANIVDDKPDGFFDAKELSVLDSRELRKLIVEVRGVHNQLEADIRSYDKNFLSNDDLAGARKYTSVDNPAYQDTLAMGMMHDFYVKNGMEPSSVSGAIHEAVHEFVERSNAVLAQASDYQARMNYYVGVFIGGGPEDIATLNREGKFDDLSADQKGYIRDRIENDIFYRNLDAETREEYGKFLDQVFPEAGEGPKAAPDVPRRDIDNNQPVPEGQRDAQLTTPGGMSA